MLGVRVCSPWSPEDFGAAIHCAVMHCLQRTMIQHELLTTTSNGVSINEWTNPFDAYKDPTKVIHSLALNSNLEWYISQ